METPMLDQLIADCGNPKIALHCRAELQRLTEPEPTIQEQARRLYEITERDLTPEQLKRVKAAQAGIRGVVELYGEEGQIALSLCAADFAAE